MRTAVYAGSFDPLTNGHVDLIERAASLFDVCIVAVLVNVKKQALFNPMERIELIREATQHLKNIQVDQFPGLLVDYLKTQQVHIVVRGVRTLVDFETEMQLAALNKDLLQSVETIFLPASREFAHVSSSMIKEIASYHGDVSAFVPHHVAKALSRKYS